MTQPNLINLHPKDYNQGSCYHPFAVSLDRRVASFNTFNDLSKKSMYSTQNRIIKSKCF